MCGEPVLIDAWIFNVHRFQFKFNSDFRIIVVIGG